MCELASILVLTHYTPLVVAFPSPQYCCRQMTGLCRHMSTLRWTSFERANKLFFARPSFGERNLNFANSRPFQREGKQVFLFALSHLVHCCYMLCTVMNLKLEITSDRYHLYKLTNNRSTHLSYIAKMDDALPQSNRLLLV